MQAKNVYPKGRAELRNARKQSTTLLIAVFVFSIFVNLLMLTGPLYMLQVYDRVLSSRSVETLTALTILVLLLYVMMGFLDWARGRVMASANGCFSRCWILQNSPILETKASVALAIWQPYKRCFHQTHCSVCLTCHGRQYLHVRFSFSIRCWASWVWLGAYS